MSTKKKATRVSYGEALKELGSEHEDLVVLEADLASATKTDIFRAAFPDRHIECGIAEQNMYDIAAGMSTAGLVPFASTFAMFSAGRAYEMIRNTIGYPHLNVKIAATHGGISVGEDGASHQCCEDFGLMRLIPGMIVMCPCDDAETKAMVRWAYEYQGPVYMRFSRAASDAVHEDGYVFEPLKAEVLRDGKDCAVIAAGLMVSEALLAAEILEQEGISVRVLNMHTIKPLDEEAVIRAAQECGCIVTAEEHSVIGGLGGAVAETLCECAPAPLLRIGVQDTFGESGPAGALIAKYKLDGAGVYEQVKAWLA